MSDLRLSLKLTADGRQMITVVDSAKKEVKLLSGELDRSQGASRTASSGLRGLEQQSERTSLSMTNVAKAVTGTFAAFGIAGLAKSATQELMVFQDLRTRLESLSGSAIKYAQNEAYLIELSASHHKELTSLGNSYSALLNLQESGLLNQSQARSILEGMSNAQSALGASSEQLGQTMYGLSQALASPIVRAEEFNQVTEPLPGLMAKLDKAVGAGAGSMRRLVLAGQMTSSMFRDYLIKALNEYDGAAASTANNISAMYRDNKNSYQQLVLAYEKPLNNSLVPMLRTSSDAMQLFADNANTVIDVVGVALAAALGRGTVAIGAHSISLISNAIASDRARTAAIAEAEIELTRASAQRAASISAGQATIAEARLTAARTALTAATSTATIATRTFSSAMSLVGGPAGLVIMAASALSYFAWQADTAKLKVSDLDDEVDVLLGRMDKVKQRKLDLGIEHQQQQLEELQTMYNELAYAPARSYSLVENLFSSAEERRVAEREANRERAAQLVVLSERISKVKADIVALNNEMSNVGKSDANQNNSGNISGDNQSQTLLDNLRKQVTLYGQASESAKLFYELEAGSLVKIAEPMKEKLIRAALDLDAQKAAAEQQKLSNNATERYQSLIVSLRTEGEKVNAQLIERVGILNNVNLSADEYAASMSRIAQATVTDAPKFGGLDASVGGVSSELNRVDNAQADLQNWYDSQLILQQQFLDQKLLNEQLYADNVEDINRTYQDRLVEIDRARAIAASSINREMLGNASNIFGSLSELTGTFAGEQSGIYKVMFAASKAFSIAQSIVAIQTGIAQAAAMPFPANLGAMATVAASTASIIKTIKGTEIEGIAHDGLPINRNEGTFLLREGEMVLNPKQRDNFEYLVDYAKADRRGGNGVIFTVSPTIVVQSQSEVGRVEDLLPQIVNATKAAVAEDLNMRGPLWAAIR